MLPYLAGIIYPELRFAKRCIKFIVMRMQSDNNTVKTISMVCVNGFYSVIGANYRVLSAKYGMNLNNIRYGMKDVEMRMKILESMNKSRNCVR